MEAESERLIGSMDGGCSCGAASLGIFTYVFVFFSSMSVGVFVCARAFDAFAASLFVAGLPLVPLPLFVGAEAMRSARSTRWW